MIFVDFSELVLPSDWWEWGLGVYIVSYGNGVNGASMRCLLKYIRIR